MHTILKLLEHIGLVGELNSSTTLNFNRRNTLSNMLFSEGALETMALNRFAAKLCAVIIALAQQYMSKKRSNLDWTLPRRRRLCQGIRKAIAEGILRLELRSKD